MEHKQSWMKPQVCRSVGSAQILYFLWLQVCFFLKVGSIHKAGLEFNQQKSSLSHKEKALKSYYDAQSLHCFSVTLQHTVRCLDAKPNQRQHSHSWSKTLTSLKSSLVDQLYMFWWEQTHFCINLCVLGNWKISWTKTALKWVKYEIWKSSMWIALDCRPRCSTTILSVVLLNIKSHFLFQQTYCVSIEAIGFGLKGLNLFQHVFWSISDSLLGKVTLVKPLGQKEAGLAFNRKGRALSGEHMKEELRHLGALMTDWAALFWLKSSFNMHDKRGPSGTFPGNSTGSPDKLLLF